VPKPPSQVSRKAVSAIGHEGIGVNHRPIAAVTWMSESQKSVFHSPGAGRHHCLAQGREAKN